ncbi:MAG: redoxin domain-containing protein [Proteobacteria bacterium]|nr:redoxin domain-containing protein [Pseudomonadota bacterium]
MRRARRGTAVPDLRPPGRPRVAAGRTAAAACERSRRRAAGFPVNAAGSALTGLQVSNLLQWVAVLLLITATVMLARQLAIFYRRIAPVGALMLNRGLAVGEPVPVLEVTTLEGATLRLGAARGDSRSTLLLFVSPTCPVCKALLSAVKSARRDERQWLDVVLASDGEAPEHQGFVRRQGLTGIPYVLSAPLGMTYQVARLPYAALIDAGGVLRARGLINSREHLESLFEAQRLGVASLQQYFAGAA